jgi:hypothetical protein
VVLGGARDGALELGEHIALEALDRAIELGHDGGQIVARVGVEGVERLIDLVAAGAVLVIAPALDPSGKQGVQARMRLDAEGGHGAQGREVDRDRRDPMRVEIAQRAADAGKLVVDG